MSELHHLSASEQLDGLRRGELSPRELVEHALARIERLDTGSDALGAFATTTPDAALRHADRLAARSSAGDSTRDSTRSAGRAAALWGLPLADKDLTARAGVRTMFGSRLFRDHVPDVSDELADALDATGAISLGKTNAPEFGMPSYTSSRVAPPAVTPYDPSRHAGGSSGGAAVAVAAGMLPVAIGTDGGGSIRIPAAATGLVGLKPSRGRVPSASGLNSAPGLVVAGPIARTVADAGLVLDALVAASPYEHSTRAPTWDGGPYLGAAVRGEGRFQLGVSTWSPWAPGIDVRLEPEAVAAFELAQRELAALGHGLDAAPDPDAGDYADAFRIAWQSGAATIPVEDSRLGELESLTRWLVERGRALPAAALSAALGSLAAFERRVIRAFAPFDAVLTPGMAMTPRPLDWYDLEDAERNFAQQCAYTPFTSYVNVAGLPAISLPVHETADGLPMAVQLVGRPGGEHVLLALGAQLERRLRWQRRHPPQW